MWQAVFREAKEISFASLKTACQCEWEVRNVGIGGNLTFVVLRNGETGVLMSVIPGLYPSTFTDPRFRKEDSVFVMHECSKGQSP